MAKNDTSWGSLDSPDKPAAAARILKAYMGPYVS
jgi:hypothetical protein